MGELLDVRLKRLNQIDFCKTSILVSIARSMATWQSFDNIEVMRFLRFARNDSYHYFAELLNQKERR